MTFKDTTSNPSEKFCVDLGNGFYALKFQYHIADSENFSKVISKVHVGYKTVAWAQETPAKAGTKRMDSKSYKFLFPKQIEKAKSLGLNLSDYVLIRLI